MALKLYHKGLSRCFVFDQSHVSQVVHIMDDIDSHETRRYMPSEWVTVYNEDNSDDLVYTRKFDINLIELVKECAARGIAILIVNERDDEDFD